MVEPTPITDAGLAELERRLACLGGQTWECIPGHVVEGNSQVRNKADEWLLCELPGDDYAYVIAAFLTDAPSILARLRTSEARVKELETASDTAVEDLFNKVYANCVIKYDPEAGKRCIQAVVARAEKAEAEVARLRSECGAFTQRWRDDAFEAAATIADRYGQPHVAKDIRVLSQKPAEATSHALRLLWDVYHHAFHSMDDSEDAGENRIVMSSDADDLDKALHAFEKAFPMAAHGEGNADDLITTRADPAQQAQSSAQPAAERVDTCKCKAVSSDYFSQCAGDRPCPMEKHPAYHGPARDGIEAQHGLNDIYPGDPYPPSAPPAAGSASGKVEG